MITTLTLNPAFDIHITLNDFRLGRENLAETVTRDIGGKGINISRALCENHIENTAFVLLGRENGADFARGLAQAGIRYQAIECQGRIRENITIHPTDGEETRLSFKGFWGNASHLNAIEQQIGTTDIVTFTGSLPPGIGTEETEAFLLRLKQRGAKLVIDSKSITLDMLRRIQPWLIKPNAEEIEAYFGKTDEQQLYHTALSLHRDGIENVLISLGADGAVLAADGNCFRARAPKIRAVSTIGAGDSMIAGFLACGTTPKKRLCHAVAYGTAACLREGTAPPKPSDIQKIYHQITVE